MHTINKYKNKIMAQLSDRLNRLAPSATLAMSQKSKKRILRAVSVSDSTQDFLCYNHENMNF